MRSTVRLFLDIALRSIALAVLSEAVASAYAASTPGDDGLGAGLTAMFALVCAAAGWGLWDGFHRTPLRLCVTWMTSGLVVSIATTIYSHLRYGEWSWSEVASDLSGGLGFWAALIFVPAIACGIVQSAIRGRPGGPVGVR